MKKFFAAVAVAFFLLAPLAETPAAAEDCLLICTEMCNNLGEFCSQQPLPFHSCFDGLDDFKLLVQAYCSQYEQGGLENQNDAGAACFGTCHTYKKRFIQ
jgi:hypothetical protein